MKKITLSILFVMISIVPQLFAQVIGRIEYDLKDSYENELVLPLGKDGLLIQSFSSKSSKGLRYFKTEYYSTDFKLLSTDSILVDKNKYHYSDTYSNGVNYTILREKGGDLSIISYDIQTQKSAKVDCKCSKRAYLSDIKVENGKVVFSTTDKILRSIVIIDMATGTTNYVDVHFDNIRDRNIYINEIILFDNNIYALVDIYDRKKTNMLLVRMDMDGNRLSTTNLTENIDETLIDASISRAGDKFFLTGTYSSKNKFPEGIYFAELEDWKLKFVKTYNFLYLQNFTEFMSAKTKAKIERRKERAEKSGKELINQYRMASHPILTDGKDYFYLGEAYYPTYIVYKGTSIFNGYYYTHSILVKFDSNGDLIWDTCFPMKPRTLPMYIKRFVSASLSDKNVSLIYSDGKKLVSKLLGNVDGSVLKDRTVEIIETDNEAEVVRKSSSNTEFWYDNIFVVYGNQTVNNTEKNARRKVFFINKYIVK